MTVEPSGLLPHVRTPRSFIRVSVLPSGVVQRWPGWMTTWGAVAGLSAMVYGSGPRMIATSPGLSASASPSSGSSHASPRTIATSVSGASS